MFGVVCGSGALPLPLILNMRPRFSIECQPLVWCDAPRAVFPFDLIGVLSH